MPTIDLDNARIFYRQDGDGPPLLLIHGWGVSGAFWLDAVQRLAQHYRCLVPDLPGFGRSSKPRRGYSIARYTDWMVAFLNHLQVDSFYLVGHSMGGVVAMEMALRHSKRVLRMVVANSLVYGRRASWVPLCWMQDITIARILHWLSQRRLLAAHGSWRLSSRTPLPSYVLQEILMGSVYAWSGCARAIWQVDLRARLPGLHVPTLVINAAHDHLLRPQQSALPAKFIPGAYLVCFSDTGHCAPVEAPARFSQLTQAFFGAHLCKGLDNG